MIGVSCGMEMNDRLKEFDIESKKARIEKARRVCFGAFSRLYNSTFEKDLFPDISNPLRTYAERYVCEWTHNKTNGHSLFMYGATGIGKSFYGACITNALLEKDSSNLYCDLKVLYCFMPSLEWSTSEERNAVLEKVKASDFVFVDELDATAIPRNAINFYFTFFNTLYERSIPFVLTTNASPESMFADKQNDVRFAKIYDRISHQCAKYGFVTNKFSIRTELAKREREEYLKSIEQDKTPSTP